VLGPIIRAYRDQKRFKEAERWAFEAAKRYPLDPTWIKLRGLVLADPGEDERSDHFASTVVWRLSERS
jgi:hypothetical protein